MALAFSFDVVYWRNRVYWTDPYLFVYALCVLELVGKGMSTLSKKMYLMQKVTICIPKWVFEVFNILFFFKVEIQNVQNFGLIFKSPVSHIWTVKILFNEWNCNIFFCDIDLSWLIYFRLLSAWGYWYITFFVSYSHLVILKIIMVYRLTGYNVLFGI